MSRMRYCEQCGSPLVAGAEFCDNCGAPVTQAAANSAEKQNGAQRQRNPQSAARSVRQAKTPERREAPGGNPGSRYPETNQPTRPIRRTGTTERREAPGGNPGSRYPETNQSARPVRRTGTTERKEASGGNPGGRYPETSQSARSVRRTGTTERREAPGGNPGSTYPETSQPARRPGMTEGGQIPRAGGARTAPSMQDPAFRQPAPYPAQDWRNRQGPSPEEDRRSRYRQEELETDWQQSWDRMPPEEDETRITPAQYVLIGITVVLLIALIVFGVFWIVGRSTDKNSTQRNAGQTEANAAGRVTEKETDAITILDGSQTAAGSQTVTEKQTEAPVQTEAQDIALNYSEFSLTLPASWQGKYGVSQSTEHFVFYQKASKDAGYNGTLFTISRYTDTSYKNLPNYELLGTGNGTAFVFTLPSDVQYATGDAAVSEEYRIMSKDIDTIRSGIKILVSGEGPQETEPQQAIEIQNQDQQVEYSQTQGTASGGYLSESSSRLLTDADVSGMSYDDMQMAINEIYARHGRIFTTPEIKNYFESQSWYQGTVSADSFDESVFSATEAQNIQFLLGKMGAQ